MKSRILQAALIAVSVLGLAAPAFADRDDWRNSRAYERHEWREHEWREREWREHHRGYFYRPGYVYAPPPVVYEPPPPPPVYAGPAFSLTIPLR
jgi:hypothetical protein